jgi:hypothetical protein
VPTEVVAGDVTLLLFTDCRYEAFSESRMQPVAPLSARIGAKRGFESHRHRELNHKMQWCWTKTQAVSSKVCVQLAVYCPRR